mgnify:CR=1 FL=1
MFTEMFATFAAFAAGTVVITEFINKLFKINNSTAKQIMSWIMSVGLAVIGLVCQFGFFTEYGTTADWHAWVLTIVTGIGTGLASNGIYDIKFVHEFVQWLFGFMKPKTETVNE